MSSKKPTKIPEETPSSPASRLWWLIPIAAVLIAGLLFVNQRRNAYQDYMAHIRPGVTIAGLAVSGMTPDEARALVRQEWEEPLAQPIELRYLDSSHVLSLPKGQELDPSAVGLTVLAEAMVDEAAAIGAATVPKKLQAMKLPPMIKFDGELVPGGRSISWVFLVVSGALVGFAAGIMGVGGGFLTFPIFVYGLGVSSTTTVGTDIFQIVFTAGYAAISQYAIYGFIFYTLAMGMLLGSLVGIQIGAMVTKVVPGITIRGFYAMAVLAGFVNRIFALPAKLGEMEVIPISKGTGAVLETIGIWAFFVVIGGFSVWVIGTFLKNIRVLKGEDSPALEEEEVPV